MNKMIFLIKNNKFKCASLFVAFFIFIPFFLISAKTDILTEEESLWLKSRNNTIVVYPEKSFAPFSYQSNSGMPLGLSIDYIELIAEKVGAKIEYLPSKSLSQILEDIKTGKGDIITSLIESPDKQENLYFSDNYVDVSSVIVVRKDSKIKNGITMNDLNGNKVAITEGRAVSYFVSKNYPRVIIDGVTDDEIGLQQVVLGEVDAAIMDIASLSFYLSKQVLSSVNVVGTVGFDYKLSFAVPKDKVILQSILDKGLNQISKNERILLNEKWIVVPQKKENSFFSIIKNTLRNDIFEYTFFLIVVILLFLILNKKKVYRRLIKHKEKVNDIKEEVSELSEMNEMLSEELKQIKEEEGKLKEKLESINK